jgi:hypothetical protein
MSNNDIHFQSVFQRLAQRYAQSPKDMYKNAGKEKQKGKISDYKITFEPPDNE